MKSTFKTIDGDLVILTKNRNVLYWGRAFAGFGLGAPFIRLTAGGPLTAPLAVASAAALVAAVLLHWMYYRRPARAVIAFRGDGCVVLDGKEVISGIRSVSLNGFTEGGSVAVVCVVRSGERSVETKIEQLDDEWPMMALAITNWCQAHDTQVTVGVSI